MGGTLATRLLSRSSAFRRCSFASDSGMTVSLLSLASSSPSASQSPSSVQSAGSRFPLSLSTSSFFSCPSPAGSSTKTFCSADKKRSWANDARASGRRSSWLSSRARVVRFVSAESMGPGSPSKVRLFLDRRRRCRPDKEPRASGRLESRFPPMSITRAEGPRARASLGTSMSEESLRPTMPVLLHEAALACSGVSCSAEDVVAGRFWVEPVFGMSDAICASFFSFSSFALAAAAWPAVCTPPLLDISMIFAPFVSLASVIVMLGSSTFPLKISF
mmetsp:Transcript_2570/g.5367  ORF Transcript_2570/g.5367 Transcript_2570/m.5367 type:complete len:275 (+) Transcript_2570:409-1233(+)